jgi:chromosome segregation ATPase
MAASRATAPGLSAGGGRPAPRGDGGAYDGSDGAGLYGDAQPAGYPFSGGGSATAGAQASRGGGTGAGSAAAALAADPAAAAALAGMDEEDVELMRNFGEHALMGRVQAALKAQLSAAYDRAEAELREQEEAREKARRAREEVGVELYGVQQQLARLQAQLEGATSGVSALQGARALAEANLASFQQAFGGRQAEIEAEGAKLEKFRGELDGITDTIRQVDKYNEEMAAEIALTRRAAYKAEESLGDKEKGKKAQDLYLDQLGSQVKAAADSLAVFEAQIGAQRAESEAATAAMADANAEMETIRFEKKQLLQQWQSSLVAMRRRDEALTAAQRSISDSQQALASMDAEEGNVRKAIVKAQELHAKHSDTHERLEGELKLLEGQLAALGRAYDGLEERREALAGTLEGTDAEVKKVVVEQARLLKSVRDLDNARAGVERQRFGLEDEIREAGDSKTTHEKAARALVKDATRLIGRVHDMEMQKAEMENQIAAAKGAWARACGRKGGLGQV